MTKHSFKDEYENELNTLKKLSKKFAQKHPSIAPMLSETNSDPDIQRLFEGVAFLNSMIHKRLNDNFPEILYELIEILFPYYLKPTPSMSVLKFFPDDSLQTTLKMDKAMEVASNSFNGIKCKFQTCWETQVSPIQLINSRYIVLGDNYSELSLKFDSQIQIDKTMLDEIDFFINENNSYSSILASLLLHFLDSIELIVDDKPIENIHNDSLINLGFDNNFSLYPYSNNSLSNYKLLKEYFVFPQKFLFFRLMNLKKVLNSLKINSFEIKFKFNKSYSSLRNIEQNLVNINCVPIINLFRDNCEPINLKNGSFLFEITPSWKYKDSFRIYNVLDVIGIIQGSSQEIIYNEFNQFSKDTNSKNFYKISRKKSLYDSNIEECYIELFKNGKIEFNEILSLSVDITNGDLASNLGIGDICLATQSTSSRVKFENITIPTRMIESPIDNDNLWFLITHATTNILNIQSAQRLKSILKYYISNNNNKDKSKILYNLKKIDSIIDLRISSATFLFKGTLLGGTKIELTIDGENFVSIGDMLIFTDIIHNFFAIFSSINSFVELIVYDKFSGESFKWKPQNGAKIVI